MAVASGLVFAAFNVPILEHEAADAGVTFQWSIKDNGHLLGCMEAKTSGWVAVGFNTRDGLEGARLVMGRVVGGKAHAEVHIAKPPQHFHRVTEDGAERVTNVTGRLVGGTTTVCFTMPLEAADTEDVPLVAGKKVHLILAWSHEDDFQHHSAQRGSRDIVL
jgi:DOMON domain